MCSKVTFEVGMTCGGCAAACKRILGKQAGVTEVTADMDSKMVVATGSGMDPQALLAALQKWANASKKSLKLVSSEGGASDGGGEAAAAAAPAPAPVPAAFDFASVVGMTGEEAKSAVLAGVPGVTVHIVPDGSMVNMDFRTDRVRVFVDADGKVARAPNRG